MHGSEVNGRRLTGFHPTVRRGRPELHGSNVRRALLGAGVGLGGFVVVALLCAAVAFSWVASSSAPSTLGWPALLAAQLVATSGADTISLVTGPLLSVLAVVVTIVGGGVGAGVGAGVAWAARSGAPWFATTTTELG